MLETDKNEILIVDDDKGVRDSLGLVLQAAGYDVSLAEHGFDALMQLRRTHPALIISDLNMPQMSGFEFLSVVRRRFPHISVIAMSGAYHCGNTVPGGVIADAFYPKGQGVRDLLKIVAELIHTSEERQLAHQTESAPVWIPRNGKNSSGVPYVVLTCTECLRSFAQNVVKQDIQKIQETSCLFCLSTVRYIIDFSLSVVSPRHEIEPVATTSRNGAMKSESEVVA